MEQMTVYSKSVLSRRKRQEGIEKYKHSLKTLEGLISYSRKVKLNGLWLQVETAERIAVLATLGMKQMEER